MFLYGAPQTSVFGHRVEYEIASFCVRHRLHIEHEFNRRPPPAKTILGPNVHGPNRLPVPPIPTAGRNMVASFADVKRLRDGKVAIERPRRASILREAKTRNLRSVAGIREADHSVPEHNPGRSTARKCRGHRLTSRNIQCDF